MPKTKITQKDVLDKFYTKPRVAAQCVETLLSLISQDMNFVEPSAGSGVFKDALLVSGVNRCKVSCYDIKPEREDIEQQDFLLLQKENLKYEENVVFVGNPPFGSRNKTTDLFIKHCIRLKADTIAFILPEVYSKFVKQKVFPEDYKLISITDLPEYSFTFEGNEYHIPSTFQVWKRNTKLQDLRKKEFTESKDFVIMKNSDKEEADFFVFGSAPQNILEISEVKPNNRGYYLKSFIDKEELKSKIKAIRWKNYGNSSVNGGVFWLTKSELYEIYVNIYGEI